MKPTVQLKADTLIFAFPEITQQLNALLDKHMQQLPLALRLPDDRSKLVGAVKELAKGREWGLLPNCEGAENPPKSLEAAAGDLTAADVEKALRSNVHFPPPTIRIGFERTLRLPVDRKKYLLPAGIGDFPLRSVDDFADTLPAEWVKRGGVLMPMYQSDAMCIRFSSRYPFAVKIGYGKTNAVSGRPWVPHLQQDPQNYVLVPEQSWLDGFSVGKKRLRQFVAAPLGKDDSVEAQLPSKADSDGVQIQACPVHAEMFFRARVLPCIPANLNSILPQLFPDHLKGRMIEVTRSRCGPPQRGGLWNMEGYTQEEIYKSPYGIAIWDQTQTPHCFIHLCNSQLWKQITHTDLPHRPMTAIEYKRTKIPWFDHYCADQPPPQKNTRRPRVLWGFLDSPCNPKKR